MTLDSIINSVIQFALPAAIAATAHLFRPVIEQWVQRRWPASPKTSKARRQAPK